MSFYEEQVNLSKDYSDRYKNCKILVDKETGETLLSTREIQDIPVHSNDNYYRVEVNEINRLDLIAYKYYNNPLLWWVIAQANNIIDPFEELEIGTLIRVPCIESLYGTKGILL